MVSVSLGHGISVVRMWCWCHQGVLSVGVISRTWCWCCRDMALVLLGHGVGVVKTWCQCCWYHQDVALVSLGCDVGVIGRQCQCQYYQEGYWCHQEVVTVWTRKSIQIQMMHWVRQKGREALSWPFMHGCKPYSHTCDVDEMQYKLQR